MRSDEVNMKQLPIRKPNRLKNYDYSQSGSYFVTICTKNNECLFGEIINGEMRLNEWGKIAQNELCSIAEHYENVVVDKFVIMPNHVHMIISIRLTERINPFPTVVDVPNIVGKYKAGVTRIVGNAFMRSEFERKPIWQKSYHDHIIRNQDEYNRIAKYIESNPANWNIDCLNNVEAISNHPNRDEGISY